MPLSAQGNQQNREKPRTFIHALIHARVQTHDPSAWALQDNKRAPDRAAIATDTEIWIENK